MRYVRSSCQIMLPIFRSNQLPTMVLRSLKGFVAFNLKESPWIREMTGFANRSDELIFQRPVLQTHAKLYDKHHDESSRP